MNFKDSTFANILLSSLSLFFSLFTLRNFDDCLWCFNDLRLFAKIICKYAATARSLYQSPAMGFFIFWDLGWFGSVGQFRVHEFIVLHTSYS